MATIKTFIFNPFQENTYLVYDKTKECIIVDAGCYTADEQSELTAFISQNNLIVKQIVNTHGHVDHVLGNAFVKTQYKASIAANPEDYSLMQSATAHAIMYGLTIDDVPGIDINLNHGDTILFGETTLKVIHTPGHSQGGICLLSEADNFVLSGDTLFRSSIGRTDLPGGDYDQLINSIETKLLTLSSETKVYPGHGEPTTIGWEKQNNPFLAKQ
ncbi:MAG TPA: MBL fold metallo-hydrolase [Tenuifilaceae bacterium]|nr:MBL fold metallo-hydrolase [Tenuifilaceae bacterium]